MGLLKPGKLCLLTARILLYPQLLGYRNFDIFGDSVDPVLGLSVLLLELLYLGFQLSALRLLCINLLLDGFFLIFGGHYLLALLLFRQ